MRGISVAVVGNATIITFFIVNLFVGFSIGSGVITAQAIGAKDEKALHKIVHTSMPVSVICGIVVTFVGVVFSKKLLLLMNTPESVLYLSDIYVKVYFSGAIFMLIYNFGASILRAAGDTKTPLIFLVVSGVLNVILNIIFVTQFNYKSQVLGIIRIGLPAGLQNALFSISNIVIQSSVNAFGDVLMAGNATAGNVEGFIYVALNSFMQTSLNFVGQNVGAKQYKRVKKVFTLCIMSVFAVGIVLTTLINLFGTFILSIYITDSPEAIEYGLIRLRYVGYAYCIGGIVDVISGALRGMGTSVLPMLISVFGVCGVRIMWIYTIFQIPRYHTPQCLYSSYGISYIITLVVMVISFTFVFRKKSGIVACESLLT